MLVTHAPKCMVNGNTLCPNPGDRSLSDVPRTYHPRESSTNFIVLAESEYYLCENKLRTHHQHTRDCSMIGPHSEMAHQSSCFIVASEVFRLIQWTNLKGNQGCITIRFSQRIQATPVNSHRFLPSRGGSVELQSLVRVPLCLTLISSPSVRTLSTS